VSVAFWSWIVLTVLLALAESINADLFMLPWSAGGIAAASLEAFHVSSGWQWVAFFGLSSVLLVVIQRLKRRREQAESGPRGGGPLS
jgi:membrane protein implicated in regulation of membrane protease activity